MTIEMPILSYARASCCQHVLASLYGLYLDHIHVVWTGSKISWLLHCDLKFWHPRNFINFVIDGEVHCKKVTFTLEVLADEKDERNTTTRIANVIPKTKILYVLDIVQDGMGRQSERVYASDVRFRPLPLKD